MSHAFPTGKLRPRRGSAARLRRLAAALAAVTCSLLASAAIMPAASADEIPARPGGAHAPVPATPIR